MAATFSTLFQLSLLAIGYYIFYLVIKTAVKKAIIEAHKKIEEDKKDRKRQRKIEKQQKIEKVVKDSKR